jgi:hypothetical protein
MSSDRFQNNSNDLASGGECGRGRKSLEPDVFGWIWLIHSDKERKKNERNGGEPRKLCEEEKPGTEC